MQTVLAAALVELTCGRASASRCSPKSTPPAVAESTGASMQTGDRTFLHATGFLINPEGKIATAVRASGPIGRVTPSEILRTVIFARSHAK